MTDKGEARSGLVALLEPILELLGRDLADTGGIGATASACGATASACGASATGAERLAGRLTSRWPLGSSTVTAIDAALHEGVARGWLCDRGEPLARFSRLAKPSPATHMFSLDVVSLEGVALEHAHPAGEITLALPATAADTEARFDGRAAGWVVLPAGSRHVPTVTGGRMILLYALPGGAIAWGP